jgi:hypothetical protein
MAAVTVRKAGCKNARSLRAARMHWRPWLFCAIISCAAAFTRPASAMLHTEDVSGTPIPPWLVEQQIQQQQQDINWRPPLEVQRAANAKKAQDELVAASQIPPPETVEDGPPSSAPSAPAQMQAMLAPPRPMARVDYLLLGGLVVLVILMVWAAVEVVKEQRRRQYLDELRLLKQTRILIRSKRPFRATGSAQAGK